MTLNEAFNFVLTSGKFFVKDVKPRIVASNWSPYSSGDILLALACISNSVNDFTAWVSTSKTKPSRAALLANLPFVPYP